MSGEERFKVLLDRGQWTITIVVTVVRAIPLFFGFDLTLVTLVIFLFLDVVTAVAQAYCVSRVIWSEGTVRLYWGVGAAVCFFAPYVYVILVGETPPMFVYIILAAWIILMAILAIWKTRKELAAKATPE